MIQVQLQIWALVLSALALVGALVGSAWYLGSKIGSLQADLMTVIGLANENAIAIRELNNKKVDTEQCRELREACRSRE